MEPVGADDYESLPSAGPMAQMIGGAFAGIMEHCLVYPMDSVKTRMQSLRSRGGILYTYRMMVRQEGVWRSMRGMPAVVLGAGPAHAAYFATYENLRDAITRQRLLPAAVSPGAAGVVATLVHDALMTPADAVKQRMQMYNSPFGSCRQCARCMLRQEGLAAFFRAYTTQLSMNVPFQAIHFVCYEQMQNVTNRDRVYCPSAHMLSGAVAGGAAAAITTPLDVCKTLLNTQETTSVPAGGCSASAGGGGRSVVGMANAIRCVYSHGGMAGFWRGLQARVCYQIPSTAICWTAYESMKFALSADARDCQSVSVPRICPPVSFTTAHAAADNS